LSSFFRFVWQLEYLDSQGRELNAKEAFRELSHKFHGKGSGKKKTEKRNQKLNEDNVSTPSLVKGVMVNYITSSFCGLPT